MKKSLTLFAALFLFGCQQAADTDLASTVEEAAPAVAEATGTLEALLTEQPNEVKARYAHRNPQQTLEFFGVEPGMTVVEGLPGGGWYTKLLLPYLGADGRLIGANYAMDLWPNFGFATEEFLATQATWAIDFPVDAAEWGGETGAPVSAFNFGAMPDELAGTADVVLMVRALHNLARFSDQRDFLGEAFGDSFAALKPGGVLGVVQHHARDEMSDEFADGSKGYLKKGFVIAAAEAAGFEFVAESDINANPQDQPGEDDVVWRLPPSLGTSRDNPELKAELEAVGESNRMTLKFRKPE
ncbi:MAG: methyltransferase [Woeseiaceae bacterium]|nr:methyltransferase [Woeseiaceae bacterium]